MLSLAKFNISSTVLQKKIKVKVHIETRLDKEFQNRTREISRFLISKLAHRAVVNINFGAVCVCVFNLGAGRCISVYSIIKMFPGIFTQQQGCQSVNPAMHPALRSR